MSNDQISNILTMVLIVMIVILFVLVVVYLVLRAKTKKPKKQNKQDDLLVSKGSNTAKTAQSKTNPITYNKQSIFSFMEFDKIQDNMIIRKNGNKFLMVIECQGVNYDLMSGLEKNSVEQGFIQFLNTLRYPIQIYVQTRTVNLESGIAKYKDRVSAIGDRLLRKQMEYNRKQNMGYSQAELNNAKLEVTREQNLYEYGVDLVNNTERMSLNKNILRKNYFVIIDYVPEDINTNNYGKDEFGQLEKVFDVMSNRLAEVVSNVNDASREIMTAAQSMMESSNELSVRTDSQSSSLEETAASIEEMVSNIKISAEKSLLGKNMMSESMQYIEDAANIIAQTASNIEEVYQSSEKIKDITKIIEDIAFQTNILALNASVEAARAGDQGKGFAVVASEVRNLAQTTQASVKDITELVDNTSQKIDTATQTAKQSQEIFVDLQNKVSDTSKLMETITSNALEQESGTNQISIEVNNMESATTQNAALAENSNEISKSLVEKAEFLERSIEFFKISHN